MRDEFRASEPLCPERHQRAMSRTCHRIFVDPSFGNEESRHDEFDGRCEPAKIVACVAGNYEGGFGQIVLGGNVLQRRIV